ncbi:hypothetical protein [Catenovulum sediminis]|uniref:hypothetical protein n=1 Tax=Catenovulum sediminis TaxID=1740262 RepID=UPI00117F011A|nr:hypothetical protein [Catenovulum sediminis]
MYSGNAVKDAFNYLSQWLSSQGIKKADAEFECTLNNFRDDIDSVKNVDVLLGTNRDGDAVTFNVKSGLESPGGLQWHLSAMYLNAYFGFYSLPVILPNGEILDTVERFMSHVYGYSLVHGIDDLGNKADLSYTDGSTDYSGIQPSSSCT